MRAFLLTCLLWLPHLSFAQGAATLVADNVALTAEEQLVASGNVEVLFDGSRLTASAIIFDRVSDTLQIEGPIFITTADRTILTATQATLDPRLENGILQGARIVLDQQLQLVAAQINRVNGRYSQLYKTSATSCRVCGTGPPLWEIRSERVIHDQLERQLYFENATFRVRGVPLLWLPRMRLPDPTLERATGLLVPEQRNTTQLGFGIKLPYFITLGDHRDLTVTPYVSAETRTLELRYRQAFARGDLEIDAAMTDDTLLPDARNYLFANGDFALSDGYQLDFDIELTSDAAYLSDYGYSTKDRLDSAVSLLRVTDATLFQTRLTYYESLRDNENNNSLPPIVADLRYEGLRDLGDLGMLGFEASLDTSYRYSDQDGDKGRDVTRATLAGDWFDTFTLSNGIIAEASAGARADLYLIDDDSTVEPIDLRFTPSAQVVLRWPLIRRGNGTTDIIEPVVSVSWADGTGTTPPNEDSTRSELDQGNLFALSRFAGEDAIQTGTTVAAGISWTHLTTGATSTTLSFGRVISQDANAEFTASSGLTGDASNWLIAGQITGEDGFILDARTLWDDDGSVTVAEARVAWDREDIRLGVNFNWQGADLDEDRPATVSEVALDAGFDLGTAWTIEVDGRYDVADDRLVETGIGLQWRNECVTVDVSASRRFASSSTVEPTTTFGISGSIGGFSTGRSAGGTAAGCRN